MSWEQLIQNINQWGEQKEINNETTQFAKIIEEVGEIAHCLTRGQYNDGGTLAGEDAIGDTLVTIILFCRIVNIDPKKALEEAWNVIKDRTGKTSEEGIFIKSEDLRSDDQSRA